MTMRHTAKANGGKTRGNAPLVLFLASLMVLAFGAPAAFAGHGKHYHVHNQPAGGYQAAGGGYTGPGPALVTAEEAKGLGDDARVALKGRIVQRLGKDHYLFQDGSGTIKMEIEDELWRGQQVGPADLVEIHGEVDKDMFHVKIEADRVVKQ